MNNFKTYQAIHKKLATAEFFNNDKRVEKMVDDIIDSNLDQPGILNKTLKPLKKMYLNVSGERDNITKGIKNLGPEYLDLQKEILKDQISSAYSNALADSPWEDKLNYFGSALGSYFGGAGDTYNRFNNTFLKSNLKPVMNNWKKNYLLPKGVTKGMFIKALREGKFNNKENANKFLTATRNTYTRPKTTNWLYKLLAYLFLDNKFADIEKQITSKYAGVAQAEALPTQENNTRTGGKAITFKSTAETPVAPGMNNDGSGADWINAAKQNGNVGGLFDQHLKNYYSNNPDAAWNNFILALKQAKTPEDQATILEKLKNGLKDNPDLVTSPYRRSWIKNIPQNKEEYGNYISEHAPYNID
jgi:hypothetical protein